MGSMGLEEVGWDVQLMVAKWLDLRSLCRLERVSKSMRLIARHKSLYAKLRRLTIRLSSHFDHHSLSTNLPLLYTLQTGGRRRLGGDGEDGLTGDKEEPPRDPMELVLAEGELSVVVGFLLRHVLDRGARLASLEVLGKENLMAPFENPWSWFQNPWSSSWGRDARGLLLAIGKALAGKDVKLQSLAVSHVSGASPTDLAAFIQPHLASLETLVLGPLTCGLIAMLRAQLLGVGSPTLPALKHLFLSVPDAEGLEEWLGPLWGHLELFVGNLEDGLVEEAADELAELAKAAGSTLERREELYRVVLATEGLDESALGEGALHSVDFLKDRTFLAARMGQDDTSDGGFGDLMEQLVIDAGFDHEFDAYDDHAYDSDEYDWEAPIHMDP